MKFYHHPGLNNKGGVTVAYIIQQTEKGKFVEFALAQCSDKDNYCRKTGREVALDRYIKGQIFSIVVKGGKKAIKRRIETELYMLASAIYHIQSSH